MPSLGRSDIAGRAVAALRPSLVRVSDDGRFVAHLTTIGSSEPCFDPQAPPATDDRPCVAFSVFEIGSGRHVLGPITPAFGAGDVAFGRDVVVRGRVRVEQDGGAPHRIPDGAVLEG